MELQAGNDKAKHAAHHRSPSYPVFDLGKAIEKTRAVYDNDKRAATSADVIASHLGFSAAKGPGGRAVSALKQFGLIEETAGKYRVSDLGYTLVHFDRDSDEWQSAVTDAIRRPTLFRELLEEYAGGLPSEAALRNDLLKRDFNPAAIPEVITVVRNSVSLASQEELVHNEAGEKTVMRTAADRLEPSDSISMALSPAPGIKGTNVHTFSWPLSREMTVEVRFSGPGQISAAHFERLRKYLELAKETWSDEATEF